jgi:predicted small lipoprotein YifL
MKRLTTLLAALLFLASGCGQSGPLYIPGNPTRIEQPPAAEEPADEEAEEDGDTDGDKN